MYNIFFLCLIINSVITNVHSCPSGSSKTLPKCDEYTYKNYEDRSSILSDIPDTRQIGHLSLTGTYNSMSYTTPNPQSQTQELNIFEQFKHGVRVFDIGVRTVLNYFTIYSGTVSMHRTFIDVLHELNRCLDDYPREFIILILRSEFVSPQDDLHPDNCKILNGYLTSNVGWRLVNNWTLTDTIDKLRGKILLTTNDITFIDCLFELFSHCSYLSNKELSSNSNELSIIDAKWNKYLKFVENSITQDYPCFIYDFTIYDEKHYYGGPAKYGGYTFKDKCVEPLNHRLDNHYPGANPLKLTITVLAYPTQELIDHINEINLINIHNK
ncbi:uncharacterized protein LOC103579853 [Microplitis demolitor]|uniref:uncharacterized protein LOC103579853 n=1 Tax=Microplitis demolitor TaxID=69319 RepID=UPI0004CCBBFB|nr:uncharacterized protein LOC103579853 [Microplitis demolitor]